MSEPGMITHQDPDETPAQKRMGELTREIKEALVTNGYPVSEAHAKVSDFKAAVLERMWEELKPGQGHVPPELDHWWTYKRRIAWLFGYDKAIDGVFKAMMRQESWSRVLRKPRKVVPREQ